MAAIFKNDNLHLNHMKISVSKRIPGKFLVKLETKRAHQANRERKREGSTQNRKMEACTTYSHFIKWTLPTV